ncbi:MAG: hypothetical protein LBS46_08030 [Dysgonamonadaceae bacterium]|jgi:hypothetical protein|nr:hypothetical protein [Dysgonamonadaceae bacterium]
MDYILKYKLKRYYKQNARAKNFLNLKDIHSVLVLFDTAYSDEASDCIRQLKDAGKALTVCVYQRKKDGQDYSNTGYYVVLQKAAGKWWGNPVYSIIRELEKQPFDAIIDLTVQRNTPLEYVLACTPASVKAGLKKNHFPQYDLAITCLPETENSSVGELGKQILHYLDVIHVK